MCGILGIIGNNLDQPKFKRALDTLAHRGPDGFGVWQNPSQHVTFGHRRLSIIDISDMGKQPMSYQHLTITFNGEIYNFLEIRNELKTKGFSFQSDSDTEVVLAAYLAWGADCLQKFNGMWALAIWNEKDQTLFLARDRFGKKPLFYAHTPNGFVFASEMKAIVPFLPQTKPSNRFHWCFNNIFDYENTSHTLIEGILRFPKASFDILSLNTTTQISPKVYWHTLNHLVTVPQRYEQQVEEFRALFIDACRLRMRSDVPVGTTLSGGLDSSATICTMAYIAKNLSSDRVSKDWQHAFVACFKNTFLDERQYAEKVVKYLGIPATYQEIEGGANIEDIFEYLYLFEELYITSPVPMMNIYKTVKQANVSVTIDGHGADELLSGYGSFVSTLVDAKFNLREIFNVFNTQKGLLEDLIGHSQIDTSHLNTWGQMKTFAGSHIFNYQWLLNKIGTGKYFQKESIDNMSLFNSQLFTMFHETVLPTLLRNYDRYSMANGVEIRMPFMDHRLVSYCFSLPWQSKLNGGYTKAIMRDALRPIMPSEIVNRKSKIGFNTPIVDWMKGDWKTFLLDEMSSQSFNTCTLMNPASVKKQVLSVMNDPNAKYGHGEQAWKSLSPYFWEQSLIKKRI